MDDVNVTNPDPNPAASASSPASPSKIDEGDEPGQLDDPSSNYPMEPNSENVEMDNSELPIAVLHDTQATLLHEVEGEGFEEGEVMDTEVGTEVGEDGIVIGLYDEHSGLIETEATLLEEPDEHGAYMVEGELVEMTEEEEGQILEVEEGEVLEEPDPNQLPEDTEYICEEEGIVIGAEEDIILGVGEEGVLGVGEEEGVLGVGEEEGELASAYDAEDEEEGDEQSQSGISNSNSIYTQETFTSDDGTHMMTVENAGDIIEADTEVVETIIDSSSMMDDDKENGESLQAEFPDEAEIEPVLEITRRRLSHEGNCYW